MKAGLKLNDLAAELSRQLRTKRDFRVPNSKLTMYPDNRAVRVEMSASDNFGVGKTAHQQLASYTGIPKAYYDRMLVSSPAVLADNVNHWLHTDDKLKDEQRLVRTLDGNLRAFLSPRYRMIDNYDVAKAVLPTLNKMGCSIESMNVTESHLYLKAVTPKLKAKVVKDVVQMGIMISNSEIGYGSVRIEPLLYILACTNGAVINDLATRKYHVGRRADETDLALEVFRDDTLQADDQALMMKLRDVVDAAFSEVQFNNIVERAALSSERQLTVADKKPTEVVEIVGKKLGLNDDERTDVLQHLLQGGDLSAWGLSNAITRASQDVQDYDRATQLERVGGDVLTLPEPEWSKLMAA